MTAAAGQPPRTRPQIPEHILRESTAIIARHFRRHYAAAPRTYFSLRLTFRADFLCAIAGRERFIKPRDDIALFMIHVYLIDDYYYCFNAQAAVQAHNALMRFAAFYDIVRYFDDVISLRLIYYFTASPTLFTCLSRASRLLY